MRYWAYFVAKLTVAAGVLYGVMGLLDKYLPKEGSDAWAPLGQGFDKLIVSSVFMLYFLLCAGVLYLIVRDQRYRCRVCLRQLRMPIETGSWGRMLQFGAPRIEYICPYGHGTLKADEVQISGLSTPEWTANSDDIWNELAAASKASGDEF
jgi:hypothetical protein